MLYVFYPNLKLILEIGLVGWREGESIRSQSREDGHSLNSEQKQSGLNFPCCLLDPNLFMQDYFKVASRQK